MHAGSFDTTDVVRKEIRMLRNIKDLKGYQVEAKDGKMGSVHDFLFDDVDWIIRYLVVDTGGWLPGRRVLIVPAALGEPDRDAKVFPVDLTRQQVAESPDIDTDRPVSRQEELKLYTYYAWIPYWSSRGGVHPPPTGAQVEPVAGTQAETGGRRENNDLRSAREVIGYHILAQDKTAGHVEDFLLEDDSWFIRYVEVDTKNWWPGKKVLLSPLWLKDISWDYRTATVELSRDKIKEAPEYDPGEGVTRDYEKKLHDYYGQPEYWKK